MKSQQKQELDGIIDKIIGYFRFHDRKERDDETDMWERINREIRQQEKKTRVREYIKRFLIPVSVAACLLLAYVIDKGEFSDNSWTLDAYVGQLADVAEASGQVQLLLSDKRKVQIDKDTVGIVYSSNGKIQIEQEEHTVSETSENTDEAKGFNQIIVPKGKYSQLTLSDGTRMHVNSGTRVVYPRVFADNRREIYVEGEIYLDVTPDKSRPFVVNPQDAPRQKRLLFRIRTVYPNVVELSASSLLKREDFQQFLWNVSDDTVLVVTDINLDAEYGKVWLRLVTDNRTVLTFNLVDCGIVFFDKTKYKQNFNVNY